jgi:hypothetical protein
MASGGSTQFYASPEWRALRLACLRRDGYRCVVPGCSAPATHADHTETRPNLAYLCPADRLTNLRSLCGRHDSQVKELASGTRRNEGRFTIRGCDADGWPLDEARRR